MFEKGQYVVCGSKGVCTIEEVTTLSIPGVDREREYYILKPLYVSASTVYVPVDMGETSMRNVLSSQEAEELIGKIPGIELIQAPSDKMLESLYRECIKSSRCEDCLKIIKTVYLRKLKRMEDGRKVTAVDTKYFKLAEDSLYGELAVALNIPKNEVEGYITEEMDNPKCIS